MGLSDFHTHTGSLYYWLRLHSVEAYMQRSLLNMLGLGDMDLNGNQPDGTDHLKGFLEGIRADEQARAGGQAEER